jgi:hypothetical protein
VLVLVSLTSPPFADRCKPSDRMRGESKDGRYVVIARYDEDAGKWNARWEDTKTDETGEGILEYLMWHAHADVLIADDGSRFVVFDPKAGRREEHRLQVYDKAIELVGDFGLKELLTEDELGKVSYTVNHCRFTEP